MNFQKPAATEIAFWRNERTKQQARLTEEKARVAEINRKYLEGKFIETETVLSVMNDCQTAIGVVADRVAKDEIVRPEHVTAIYDAIQPLCGELLGRIIEKITHPKIENGIQS